MELKGDRAARPVFLLCRLLLLFPFGRAEGKHSLMSLTALSGLALAMQGVWGAGSVREAGALQVGMVLSALQ